MERDIERFCYVHDVFVCHKNAKYDNCCSLNVCCNIALLHLMPQIYSYIYLNIHSIVAIIIKIKNKINENK